MMLLLIIGIIIFLYIRFNAHYFKISRNSILCFTGGLGSGKTLYSVIIGVKRLKLNVLIWKIKKLVGKIRRKPYLHECPKIYSNIPINHKLYVELRPEHLLLIDKIEENSIVIIDEVGQFASQHDWKELYTQKEGTFQEFVRFFRHYINGKLIITDQNSDNILSTLRRRVNVIYNLNNFTKVFPFYYGLIVGHSEIRELTVTEDMMTVAKSDVGEMDVHLLWCVFAKRYYASRVYKNRYNLSKFNIEQDIPELPDSLYRNDFIELSTQPKEHQARPKDFDINKALSELNESIEKLKENQ